MEAEADLIAKSRTGDQGAFRALYEMHLESLRAQVRQRIPARLRRRLSDSDVLQETYLTAFGKLGEFRGDTEGSFRRWLGRIADLKVKETAHHHLDAAKRAAARELSRGARVTTHQFRSRDPSPSEHAVAAETGVAIDRAMAALPEDYRTILLLVHERGLGLAEAGASMNRSAEAARKLYSRALARLAEGMSGDGR